MRRIKTPQQDFVLKNAGGGGGGGGAYLRDTTVLKLLGRYSLCATHVHLTFALPLTSHHSFVTIEFYCE